MHWLDRTVPYSLSFCHCDTDRFRHVWTSIRQWTFWKWIRLLSCVRWVAKWYFCSAERRIAELGFFRFRPYSLQYTSADSHVGVALQKRQFWTLGPLQIDVGTSPGSESTRDTPRPVSLDFFTSFSAVFRSKYPGQLAQCRVITK
jgi:hypothetical protein